MFANVPAVADGWKTVDGTDMEYVAQFRVSKAVAGKPTMPDAPVEGSFAIDAELWSPKFKGAFTVSAGIIDGDTDRSAGAADISLSGIAGAGGLSMTAGETVTGAAIARLADKIESVGAAAVVLVGVWPPVSFDRGLEAVEVECAVWSKVAAELCNKTPRTSEKLATNPVRELRGSAFKARPWLGEAVPASLVIGIVLDVFIRKYLSDSERGKASALPKIGVASELVSPRKCNGKSDFEIE